MGHEKSSSDWLPAGWKVQVRVRKSGKKDKCYVDPSNERKFYSKPEVLRYLKNVGVNHAVCEETKNKIISCHSAIKFVVKEAVAEGLPEGWIKETRVTQKGNKIRRDLYYIDPQSGHLFRSMKEVFRYLDTGKMGRQSSKRKDQGLINLESRHDSLSSSAETEEKRTADSLSEKQVIGDQNLKSDAAAMSDVNLPEAKKSEQRKEKETSCENSSHVAEVPIENQQTGNRLEATKHKKKKLNDKKGAELPRRTSKRLAGIEVDLSLETNMHTRVRRATARKISEAEVNSADKCENLANSVERAKRLKTGTEADKKQERLDVLPPADVFPEENAKQGIAECKGDEKLELPLDMSFKELWKDPCIEFAIKTLTGATPIGGQTKVAMNQGSSSILPDAVPGSCQDLPSNDIWADPCFEFAVKTLIGDIPVVNDTTMDTIIQQPLCNSSEIIGHNGFTLPSFRSAGFSHGNVSFRHSNVAEAPPDSQQL